MEPLRAATILRDLASALAAVHEVGIVHRDLKPDNVILRSDGAPVLIDFGIAFSASEARLTQTGALVGTPAYMAPEHLAGRASDPNPRADVYGLGAILLALLSGESPYQGIADLPALQAAVISGRDPGWAGLSAPPALIALGRCAMHPDAARRYADAKELRDALAQFLAGEAPRPRLNRLGLLGATALVIALGVVLGAVLVPAEVVTPTPLPPAANAPPPTPDPAGAATGGSRGLVWIAVESLRVETERADTRTLCAFLNRDRTLLLVGNDRPVVWDSSTNSTEPLPVTLYGQAPYLARSLLTVHADTRRALFSRGGEQLSLVSTDGGPTRRIEMRGIPTAVAFADDGQQALVGTQGGRLERIDLESGGLIASGRHSSEKTRVGSIAVFGELVATGSGPTLGGVLDSRLNIWRGQGLESVHSFETNGPSTTLAFSPDGEQLAVGTNAGRVFIYDLETGGARSLVGVGVTAQPWVVAPFAAKREVPVAHASGVRTVVFSPDGRLLYTISRAVDRGESVLRTWSTEGYDELAVQSLQVPATGTAFSRDVSRLLIAAWDGRFRLWELTR
jgi:hypothetical protein